MCELTNIFMKNISAGLDSQDKLKMHYKKRKVMSIEGKEGTFFCKCCRIIYESGDTVLHANQTTRCPNKLPNGNICGCEMYFYDTDEDYESADIDWYCYWNTGGFVDDRNWLEKRLRMSTSKLMTCVDDNYYDRKRSYGHTET